MTANSDDASKGRADLASVAQAIADPSRGRMLSALMSGTTWTVGELAAVADVTHGTASSHVRRLAEAGLVVAVRRGRTTAVELASGDVANALEALALIAPALQPAETLRAHRDAAALRYGRTCYGHLGGELGVLLADTMRARGFITEEFALTAAGRQRFAELGLDPEYPHEAPLRPCQDWTEGRPHLAGPLADQLVRHAFERGWLERRPHSRAVTLTPTGEQQLLLRDPAPLNAIRRA